MTLLKYKDFIYRTFFSKGFLQMKKEIQDRGYAQGYEDARDIYDTKLIAANDQLEAFKAKLAELNSQWFVDQVDVLVVTDKGRVLLGGEQLSDIEVKELKAEAKLLKNTRLWKVIQETLKQKAIEKAVNK